MKIVIIGLGTIGKSVLGALAHEEHTITIIDENREKVESLIERYDVFGVVGNGASLAIQKEAHVKDADLVIALTDSDELNILACLTANKAGAESTVARVRNPDYSKQIELMRDELGISMIVNPEKETADEIFRLISLPSLSQIDHFANGRVLIVEVTVTKDCALYGESLVSLKRHFDTKVLVCAVQRGDDVFIPEASYLFEIGDKIHFTADASSLRTFLSEAHFVNSPIKRVMIVGGGRVGYYLADELSKKKYKVKLIESDRELAEKLAEALPRVTVIHGNGVRHNVLLEEGIEAMDAFVALSETDEENLVVSMFANKMKVKKVFTKIKSSDLDDIIDEVGITSTVSPSEIVANNITSYIRALSNRRGSNVLTLHRLVDDRIEALEFSAKKQHRFYDKPLSTLKVKKNCLIACIIRDNEVIIPDGTSSIKLGDNVIVATTHKDFDDLSDVFN